VEDVTMLRTPWILIGGGLALLLALPVAWYLLSPLWITRAVNEPLPTAQPVVIVVATHTPVAPTATLAAPTEVMAELPTGTPVDPTPVPATATPAATSTPETQTLAQGEFYDLIHVGDGLASVFQLADGLRVLRFESFMVDNGPDLFVYLVPDNPVPNAIGFDFMAYHDLGPLKGNVGDQNYELPADLDLSLYNSVVIWCRAFKVPFAAAPLAPSGG